MNAKKIVVFISFVILFSLLCAIFLCACIDEPPPSNNNNNGNTDVVDPWYTKGYTKGEVRSEDLFRDLFTSLFNPLKSISDKRGKLNSSRPEFTAEVKLNLMINKSPARAELIINWHIDDASKRAISFTVYKGIVEEEILEIIIHPTESLKSDALDMFIKIKGINVDTRLVTEIQSAQIPTLFPLSLGDNFISNIDGLPGLFNSVVKLSTDKIKYEYKNEGKSLLKRYDIKIDFRQTLIELINNATLLPSGTQRQNVEFFLDSLLGTTSPRKQFANTMPPADLEIEFETKRENNESNINNLFLTFAVSEDSNTRQTNNRFKGSSYKANLSFEKLAVTFGSNLGLSKIKPKDSLIESNNFSDMQEGKFFRYDILNPINLLFRGKYTGEYGSIDPLNPSEFMLGLKVETTSDGEDQNGELYFKIFDDEHTSFYFKYTGNHVAVSGDNITSFSFPFDMQELINGIIATAEGEAMITTDGRMFKVITFLIGAFKMVESDAVSFDIKLSNLLFDVMNLDIGKLELVLNGAYAAANGEGVFINILRDNWKSIQDILNTEQFMIKLDLTETYFCSVENLETEFEGS